MKTKTFKTKLAATLLMALVLSFPVKAQVTIGSGLEPQRGALLDVKSKEAATPGGETTDENGGGILMPRVSLENINSLMPFIPVAEQTAQIKANHKGLMVYNLTDTGGFATGLYSWDGSQWVTFAGAGGTVYTGSASVTLDGDSFKRAALTGDVTAPANSNTLTIGEGKVTSSMIANGTIKPEDLNATGLQNGCQYYVINGAWVPQAANYWQAKTGSLDVPAGTWFVIINSITSVENAETVRNAITFTPACGVFWIPGIVYGHHSYTGSSNLTRTIAAIVSSDTPFTIGGAGATRLITVTRL